MKIGPTKDTMDSKSGFSEFIVCVISLVLILKDNIKFLNPSFYPAEYLRIAQTFYKCMSRGKIF